MSKSRFWILPILCLINTATYAQFWIDAPWMQAKINPTSGENLGNLSFESVNEQFDLYWNKIPPQKHRGYMPYQRWAYHIKDRLDASGNFINFSSLYWDQIQNKQSLASCISGANGLWQPIGPFTIPSNGGGAGRLNCIEFHPTNPNIIWVGSAGGGLWKSTNGGNSWTSNTDELAVLGVTDVVIDPVHPDTMYLATGDANGIHNLSLGLLRSHDGGNTWHQSGLIFGITQTLLLSKILINSTNSSTLLVGASNGIYLSHDGGDTWAQTLTVGAGEKVMDMEYHPSDSSIAYASVTNGGIYKSTNGGTNWIKLTGGLPVSGFGRIELAVSPAVANTVYALLVEASSGGFYRLYRSTDAGSSWTQMSAPAPNILGFQKTGNDNFGQGFYDLAMAVSPTNINEIFVGGINIWRSTDGGATWAINTYYAYNDINSPIKPYVHADQHELVFAPGSGSTVFSCNDGGLFKTANNGTTWIDLSNGLYINQIYRLGSSQINNNLLLAGTQDNGTERFLNGNWNMALDGDGMNCFFDFSNNTYAFAEFQFGQLRRSTNTGNSFPTIINPAGISFGNFITPFEMDPINPQTIYAAYEDIYKSTDRGNNWTKIGDFNGLPFETMAIAPSNPNVIYVSKFDTTYKIYKTTNGGSSWLDVTNDTLLQGITSISVHKTNPDIAWFTSGGLNDIKKVKKTTDGGNSWQDITKNLSQLPVNCAVFSGNEWDGIYIGNDIGVYYTDNRLNKWIEFSDGLPNVMIRDLELIQSTNTIRAATFGRGIWESPSYYCPPPLADFLYFASGQQIIFGNTSIIDTSVTHAYYWNFGDGDTSTQINPQHGYTSTGEFLVTLIVQNTCGLSDTITKCIRFDLINSVAGNEQTYFAGIIDAPANWKPQLITKTAGGGYLVAANIESAGLGLPGGKKYKIGLVRTNEKGGVIWARELSTGISDSVAGIVEMPGNRWLLFGKTMQEGDSLYDLSYYMVRADGEVLLSTSFGTDSTERMGQPIMDAAGDIVFYAQTDSDHLLVKMDTLGNQVWAKRTELMTPICKSHLLTETTDGYWIVAGNGTSTQVIKYDHNGNILLQFDWYFQYNFLPVAIAGGADSVLWVIGNYEKPSDWDIGLLRIGPLGQMTWPKQIGTSFNDFATGIRFENGQIQATGITNAYNTGNNRYEPLYIYGDTASSVNINGVIYNSLSLDLEPMEFASMNPGQPLINLARNDGSAGGWLISKSDLTAFNKCQFTSHQIPVTTINVLSQSAIPIPKTWSPTYRNNPVTVQCIEFSDTLWCSCKPIAMFSLVKSNDTITLTDHSIRKGQILWDFGDGQTDTTLNPMHTYASPGTYEVCLMVTNICGTDSVCQTIQIFPIGMADNQPDNILHIFPNPGKEHFKVFLPKPLNEQMNIRISDAKGGVLHTGTLFFDEGISQLNVTGLTPGLYVIHLYNGNLHFRGKFMISGN